MMRKQNLEIEQLISNGATELFISLGLTATTYSLIASETGVARELVQYHYPKKQLLVIEVFKTLLNYTDELLDKGNYYSKNTFVNLYLVSQCYYAYLLHSQNTRNFFCEVLRDRDLTDEILMFNSSWSMQYIQSFSVDEFSKVNDATLLRTGGLYDYIYHALKYDKTPEIASIMIDIILSLARDLNAENAKLRDTIKCKSLNHNELKVLINQLAQTKPLAPSVLCHS